MTVKTDKDIYEEADKEAILMVEKALKDAKIDPLVPINRQKGRQLAASSISQSTTEVKKNY
jgi:hypothetical protein